MSFTTLTRGQRFGEALTTLMLGLTPEAAVTRFGARGADYQKAAVAAITAGDVSHLPGYGEFFDLVTEQSILGRLPGIRTVPFGVKLLSMVAGAVGYMVTEGNPKPVSEAALNGSALQWRKVAAMIFVTDETLNYQSAIATLIRDLVRAIVVTLDEAFLDPTVAGSTTFGAPSINSSGNFAADMAALVSAFKGDLGAAVWVSSPTVATRIALMTDAGGRYLFPDTGPAGGSLLNLPHITTRHAPGDSNGSFLALVDATGIAANVELADIRRSNQAVIQANTTPDNPTTAATVQISLWQRNLTAFLAELRAGWDVQRAGAVAVLRDV